ncbi:hypothetical protein FZEAL_6642 [Fusarium zealandicum]|uniref:Cytochrome b5 heme-binding domain-containing protein n=1 Tax=Fusarium zealandicum TaxID=1053134 RepID=A0A8H4XIL5_9HYPO|nr:hypothetical protein FZEAL_6642 [Fusarium zealandicum]
MATAGWGKLAPVPRFRALLVTIPEPSGRKCYDSIHKAMVDLGRAVQLGHHRRLIESLSSGLGLETLEAITYVALRDPEICSALSVYLTTLEQAYHWPRDRVVSTPDALHDHKLVVQVLHQPELREILRRIINPNSEDLISPTSKHVSQVALSMAKEMIEGAMLASRDGLNLTRERQDQVNLLYRTSRGDWFVQGDYNDHDSHREFGRLHEVIRTNGTQRSVQDIFERAHGLSWLQRMPFLLQNLPSTSDILCAAFTDLQVVMALARDELFSMMIDEPIWGRTFAKFSKAVGFCTVGAGGADCPMFRMLDALCGRADEIGQAALLDELDFRSRFFPPSMRALINEVAAAPSIRAFVASGEASYELTQAFKAMEQLRFDLYEMHRKKAMRIALALRAGQQSTSSGTQKALSPEQHIASTLSAAMKVRFGEDTRALEIDAFAWSSPLLHGEDGKVQAARIRFVFFTPLAVSPGDSLSVAVEVEHGEWHTRTYSITHAYARRKASSIRVCQAVGSVEVCVSNRGKVSSYLCRQETGFRVRVMIKPAPHFRITGNSFSREETLFIAQGGAVGVFLAWLAWQDRLVGRYRLIVAARDYSTLAYANQLHKIAESFSPRLRIVVSLSKPAIGDVRKLLSGNLKAFSGRVTNYLSHYSQSSIKATYICGSSAFGLGVVRCISRQRDKPVQHTHVPRLLPIVTSSLPSIRLHVAAGSRGALDPPALRPIPKLELALHNSPGDLWIALGDRVFDITAVPSFHPGGEKVLMYRAGRQAQDVFETVHDDSYMIDSLLEEMVIGRLVSSNEALHEWEDWIDKIVEIQNDLTNHSRFEQAPTGSAHQLSQAPPAEVIRGSIECFVKAWKSLLADIGGYELEQRHLQAAHDEISSRLDRHQEKVYEEAFGDVGACAEALWGIFDAYFIMIGRIHALVDDVKRRAFNCINEGVPELSMLQECTARIALAINEIVES